MVAKPTLIALEEHYYDHCGDLLRLCPGLKRARSGPHAQRGDNTRAGSPLPVATARRQRLGLGLLDGETIVRSVLERGRTSGTGRLTVVTERIRIDDSALIDNPCARLPSDARSIRPEERLRDLAGEPYRFICKLAARG